MTDRIAEIRSRIAADNISTTEAIEEFIYRDIPFLLSQLAERDMEIERLQSEVSRLRSDNEIIKRMYVKMCEDKCGMDAEIDGFKATLAREGFRDLETMIAKYKTVMLAANETSIEQDEELEELKAQLVASQRRERAAVAEWRGI
jgi:hypothetical protein